LKEKEKHDLKRSCAESRDSTEINVQRDKVEGQNCIGESRQYGKEKESAESKQNSTEIKLDDAEWPLG
jgi:hypothetical protein